ncbi:MAG TPA: efflux RND transporter periplasmic adaptor subunit [Bacteroidales bacterium]|nr:efflux RND transporter periplasmic adaptor subunit [Bacteroidales bacterium]
MWRNKNTKLKLILSFFLTVVFLGTSCKHEQGKQSVTVPVRITLSAIRKVPAVVPLHSNGILVSSEELKLSFKTGGIVAHIPVNEGNRVKKGDVIATLDLSEIKAAVEQAELGYNKALRDYQRASNLYRDSVATLELKQNSATALDLAASRLKVASFNLTHSSITAPENGIILKIFAKESEMVASGYPVILFGSSAKFWKVKVGFSDKDIVKINIGDSARISFDAYPDKIFYGLVDQTGEMSNPMTGTYEVELNLSETELRLASGFVAGVDLFTSTSDSIPAVPVESVVEANGNEGYVYILEGDSSVVKTKIEIVLVTGSQLAVRGIPEGIKEVVSGGAAYLRDGEKVQVIRLDDNGRF